MNKDNAICVHLTCLHEAAKIPAYAHVSDAGMDLYASESVVLHPGETKLVHTGIALAIPDGYEAQIRPRSGLSLNTMLRIPNSPGTIDSGYRDEVCIILHNASFLPSTEPDRVLTLSEKMNRHGTYRIEKGDRIAQMIFAGYAKAKIQIVDDVSQIGDNRQGGFGSTGVQ